MKLISLFSGAGISDVGFHQAGLECLAQVEIDKTASSVRRRHFPDCEHHADIHEFDALRFRGTCDVLAGGFPCQDYSVAGRRAGLAGDRGALWWQMLRCIDEAQPDIVLGENVPGLLSSDGGNAFRSVIYSLVELGYSVAWRVLDLRYFGVPQRRRRVLIVGTRLAGPSRGRAGVSLFEPNCLPWNSQESREAGQGDPQIVGTLSAGGGGKGGGTTDGNETSFLVGTLAVNAGGLTRPAGNANELDFCVPEVAQCLTHHHGRLDGDSETFIPEAMTCRVRRLLPVECERLMGLPDGYTEFGHDGRRIADSARYRMLGNGWSVPQARWLAERIKEAA